MTGQDVTPALPRLYLTRHGYSSLRVYDFHAAGHLLALAGEPGIHGSEILGTRQRFAACENWPEAVSGSGYAPIAQGAPVALRLI